MIQGVPVTTYGILCFIAYTKCDFGKIEKAMMQVVTEPFANIFAFWLSQNATLGMSRNYDSRVCLALIGKLYFFAYPKSNMGEVEKAMLHVVAGSFGHIFACWLSQYTTLASSKKRWFMGLPANK